MKSIAQIAAELQGYDPQALSADQVSAFLERLALPVTATEELGIFEALGRVLARDVVSPLSVPPHDNSAMDGYALAGAQLVAGQPLTLRVVGAALAGKAWTGAVGAGECLKIMTGAIMPPGWTPWCRKSSPPAPTGTSPSPPTCCAWVTTAASRGKTSWKAAWRYPKVSY
jgi:molybdopterin molybdochelatase